MSSPLNAHAPAAAMRTRDRSNDGAVAERRRVDDLAAMPLDRAFAKLRSSPAGLDKTEAERRLAEVGPNEPVVRKADVLAMQILRCFANTLVVILVFACVVSAFVHDFANAAVILVMVGVSVTIDVVQTRRSSRAAEALEARVAQTATVVRGGIGREIPRREVVPGDVARLVDAKDLHVNEAALTGESLRVEKSPDRAEASTLFMGSSIVSATATALVTSTGVRTAFGAIAQELARRPPPTEFERGITHFGAFIMKTVVFLVLFVFATMAARGRDALESLLLLVEAAKRHVFPKLIAARP